MSTATAFRPVTNQSSNPPKWWSVYSNDRECRFFKALARGVHEWRTVAGLMKAANLSQKEVEQILNKYAPMGVVQQHSAEPDKWRYWENGTTKKKKSSISATDKNRRMKDALQQNGNSASKP